LRNWIAMTFQHVSLCLFAFFKHHRKPTATATMTTKRRSSNSLVCFDALFVRLCVFFVVGCQFDVRFFNAPFSRFCCLFRYCAIAAKRRREQIEREIEEERLAEEQVRF
jgi:hypothetical protein